MGNGHNLKWESSNALYAASGRGASDNPFSGTRQVTLPKSSFPIGLEVFAGQNATLSTLQLPEQDKAIYVWGRMAHPQRSGDDLLRWIAEIVDSGDLRSLSQLIGLFVVLIDDRRAGAIHMFSDVMGVRPWFVVTDGTRLTCGSSVWPIREAGLCGASLDYASIGSWLYFGYCVTGGSLFEGIRRLPARYVLSLRHGILSQHEYAPLQGDNRRPTQEQIADHVHDQVSMVIDRLCPRDGKIIVPLSGGYDSRLAAAIATRKKLDLHAVTIDEGEETAIAIAVADALKLSHEIMPTDGSLWNIFHEPFLSLPEGMPITRQFSDPVARKYPGRPQLNGWMGDILVRVSGNKSDRDLEFKPLDELTPALVRRRRMEGQRFDLLEPPSLLPRIEVRAQAAARKLHECGRPWGRPFLYDGTFGRHRYFMSNNMLEHLDVAEAIAPFYTWDLILSRFVNDYDCFTWETYELLFQRYFPDIAAIPHAGRLPDRQPKFRPVSRCTPRWARQMLLRLPRRDFLPVLNRRKALPRLLAAAAGRAKHERTVFFLQRLYLLEQKLKSNGITLDWGKI